MDVPSDERPLERNNIRRPLIEYLVEAQTNPSETSTHLSLAGTGHSRRQAAQISPMILDDSPTRLVRARNG